MSALKSKTDALLLGVLLLLLAGQAEAAESEQPDECLSETECNELYQTARRQSESGQHDAALINYQNAYAKKPMPWLLISIGRMQYKLQRFQPAVANFKRYLGFPIEVTDEVLRAKASTYLKEAEAGWEEQKRLQNPARNTEPPKPPVYKKWWFWTIIGGVAVGAALGVGLGVASREPDLSGLVTYPISPMAPM